MDNFIECIYMIIATKTSSTKKAIIIPDGASEAEISFLSPVTGDESSIYERPRSFNKDSVWGFCGIST